MKKILRLVLLCALIFPPASLLSQKAENFNWLTGKWKISTGNGAILESWTMVNDSTLHGVSCFIRNNGDSIPQENIELVMRRGQWQYIPTVTGQNNNLPVAFPLIFQKGNEFIALNPEHDFPQRIAYRRISATQVLASIEGMKNGAYRKQNFDFIRVE